MDHFFATLDYHDAIHTARLMASNVNSGSGLALAARAVLRGGLINYPACVHLQEPVGGLLAAGCGLLELARERPVNI